MRRGRQRGMLAWPAAQRGADEQAQVRERRGAGHVAGIELMLDWKQDGSAIFLDGVGGEGGKQQFLLREEQRGGTSDAGTAAERVHLLLGDARARANEAHVAAQHVDELREFVELPQAQDAADAGDFRVMQRGDGRAARAERDAHGAKFEDGEVGAATANALLKEQDRALRRATHGNGDEQAQGEKRGENCEDEEDVEGASDR